MFVVITFKKQHRPKFMLPESQFITNCTEIKSLENKNIIKIHTVTGTIEGKKHEWKNYDRSTIDNITLTEMCWYGHAGADSS